METSLAMPKLPAFRMHSCFIRATTFRSVGPISKTLSGSFAAFITRLSIAGLSPTSFAATLGSMFKLIQLSSRTTPSTCTFQQFINL